MTLLLTREISELEEDESDASVDRKYLLTLHRQYLFTLDKAAEGGPAASIH